MNRGELGRGEERWVDTQPDRRVIFWPLFPSSSALEKAGSARPFGWMQASMPGSGSHRPQQSGLRERSCRLVLAQHSAGPGVPCTVLCSCTWEGVGCGRLGGYSHRNNRLGESFQIGETKDQSPTVSLIVAKWQCPLIAVSILMSCRGGPETLTHSQSCSAARLR